MSFQTCMIFCFKKDAKGHMRSPYFHVSSSKSSENFEHQSSSRPAFTCIEQYNVFKKTKDYRWMSFYDKAIIRLQKTLTIVHTSSDKLNIALLQYML